jgi:hypothetical protein
VTVDIGNPDPAALQEVVGLVPSVSSTSLISKKKFEKDFKKYIVD